MGIPSYFSYVLKNHKIIKKLVGIKSSYLFMDANSIIYDVIYENDTINVDEIYKNVYNKILSIIEKIKPNTSFIAFDGVVPLAKMNQQKQRRYKSYITKQILKNNKWNTNAITPGTKFMNELDDYLSSIFKDNKNIIFTGSKQSGEGEQKIFDTFRRSLCQTGFLLNCDTIGVSHCNLVRIT